MAQTGRHKNAAKHLKTVFGISSGPLDFCSFIDDSELSTASSVMTCSSGTDMTGIGDHSSGGISLATLLTQ